VTCHNPSNTRRVNLDELRTWAAEYAADGSKLHFIGPLQGWFLQLSFNSKTILGASRPREAQKKQATGAEIAVVIDRIVKECGDKGGE
jgi:hypothetical protein